jgi:PAS domain S-box-containing protein
MPVSKMAFETFCRLVCLITTRQAQVAHQIPSSHSHEALPRYKYPFMNNPPPRPNDQLEHALLSAWLEEADVGICVLDDTARVVMLNETGARLMGVIALDVLNMPITRLLAKFDGSMALMQWMGAPGFDGERTVTRPVDSAEIHLLLKARSVKSPAAERFKVVAITDITAALESQKALDFLKRQWQALNAGVVISDALNPDMPIVYVNPTFETMSGYSAKEIMGRNCRFLQGDDRNQPELKAIRDAVRNHTNGHAVLRNYRKDGSLFMNELFISPVRDAAGVVTHFVGVQHPRPSPQETT